MILIRLLPYIAILPLIGCTAPLLDVQGQKPAAMASKHQGVVEKHQHQDTLASGGYGPRLILIPEGHFLMGSPEGEPGRYTNEGPQHEVSFERPFYLGLTEVTVGQYRRFVKATGYLTDGERNTGSYIRDDTVERGPWRLRPEINWRMDHEGNPSHDDNPVVHVSWYDAQAYLAWLSKETGKIYRLPSEAELEYGNRAGSGGQFWWGESTPAEKLVNIRGDKDKLVANPRTWEHTPVEIQYAFKEGDTPEIFEGYGDGFHGLAPVGSFSPNPFGLFDTTGNVWEWVQDCWHNDYIGAPTDGSAWVDKENCAMRIVKGGSFYCFPRHMRSANRWERWAEFRNMYIGFRVARDP